MPGQMDNTQAEKLYAPPHRRRELLKDAIYLLLKKHSYGVFLKSMKEMLKEYSKFDIEIKDLNELEAVLQTLPGVTVEK